MLLMTILLVFMDEIEAQTLLSRGKIQNTIHNELMLKKIVSRFVT
jgi:hypothetical protein